jgi:tetratricopeptide (TPR) repeat protein/serine/threonine protein kinase
MWEHAMNAEARKVRSIFLAAVEKNSPEQRNAYLDEACAGDEELRRRVEVLLRAHEQPNPLLDRPATPEATVDEPARGECPGTVIGPYKLLQQIGEGGMGLVFVAEQTQPVRRRVALKLVKPGMDSREVIARFEAERQALALMDHPNIARVFDGGTTASGGPYFVMELVKGVPITEFCDQNHVAPRHRLELFVAVVGAVQHAHQKGVIHRDLKPSNVLVASQDGTPVVKVIDFGIAKAIGQHLTDKTLFTGSAQLIGTPLYMSPEQAGQSGLDIDTRSDIYSLGVVLYELLTGTTPFSRERFRQAAYDEIRRIIREEEPPRPSTRLSESKESLPSISAQRQLEPARLTKLVRGELDWIVMKCLEKDRNRRYETANGLARDVERYLNDEPVAAGPPSSGYRLRKFLRRHRGPVLAAAVILILLVAGIIGTSLGLVRAVQAEQDADGRRVQAEAAEGRANAALAEANLQQARHAVDEMYTQVAEKWLAQQPQLEKVQREFLQKARQFYEEFARETGTDPAMRFEAARAYRRVGEVQHKLGAPAEAEHAFEKAIDRLQKLFDEYPEEPAYRQELAKTLHGFGILVGDVGRVPEEEKAHRRAIALQEKLASDFPRMPEYRCDLARGYYFAGEGLGALRQPAESERVYRESVKLMDKLVAECPAIAEYRMYLAESLYALGCRLKANGSSGEALKVGRRAIGLLEALVAEFPAAPLYRTGLAVAFCRIAEVQPPQQAERSLGKALAIQRKVAEDFPSVTDYRYNIVRSLHTLGLFLRTEGRLQEAEQALREAAQISERLVAESPTVHYYRDRLSEVYNTLGGVLAAQGKQDKAIAAYREALRIKPDYPEARTNLGNALYNKGRLDEAIAAYHDALRSRQDFPQAYTAHYNLGNALRDKGRLDEAIAAYREALRIKPDYPEARTNLGNALHNKGRLDEAIAAYHDALRSRQDFPQAYTAHDNLGDALHDKGQLEEAIAEYREALRLQKDYPQAHHSLGNALRDRGRLEEAIAEFREAIRLKGDFPEAHCNLGALLRRKGQFREALQELRRGHELGCKNPRWPYASARWVRECERLVELDGKLPSILEGKSTPASPAEQIELAGLCTAKRLHRAAARLYEAALSTEPRLATDPGAFHRYNAACAAALAGCGQGEDAGKLDGAERARLRHQALDWLRADRDAWRRRLDTESDKAWPELVRQMRHWQGDPDLAGVREPEALARLPEAERPAWRQLWAGVADTLVEGLAKTK